MKRVFSALMLVLVLFIMATPILASSETVEIPSDPSASPELSPMSGDLFNVIIILLCISGTAIVVLVLITLTSKK